MSPSLFDQLCACTRETALLDSIGELLNWDERTGLPPQAGTYRAEQVAYVSRLVHQRRTDPRVGDWLAELSASPLAADPHADVGATIRELKRTYDKQVRIPVTLVEELARASVQGQQIWVEARRERNFALFQPILDQIIRLKRNQAEVVGYEETPYDALLDDYEPGAKTARVAAVLAELRDGLTPLIQRIAHSSRAPRTEILRRGYPIARQEEFGREMAKRIGFQFGRGRLDVTEHPFCLTAGPDDCRITTRYDIHDFAMAFFGILHEAGHGIYEQGLRPDWYGLPPGSSVSLGIHESQSRLWENQIGRSLSFWKYAFPHAQRYFPDALADTSLDDFYFAINSVSPSLIRVEADEATYNLHIVIRFELERALMASDLRVEDLPQAWNEKYQAYLGVRPAHDSEGVLQDIHWSGTSIGYFPTYSLGNIYSAQIYQQALRELPDCEQAIEAGEFEPLRQWLNAKIHRWGQCYPAEQLVERITGEPSTSRPLIEYLQSKLEPLYGLA